MTDIKEDSPKILRLIIKKIFTLELKSKRRGLRYIFLLLVVLSVIWAITISILVYKAKSYESKMTMNLPGSGASSSYNIQNIGQIITGKSNPFASNSESPKVVYKNILKSDEVAHRAAKIMNTDFDDIDGNFKIKLTDQTSIINMITKGNSPENAQKKSNAIFQAFSELIDNMRINEGQSREESTKKSLDLQKIIMTKKLTLLNDFKKKTDIVSAKQFEQITSSTEGLSAEIINNRANLQKTKGEYQALLKSLMIDEDHIKIILTLQSDKIIQSSYKSYIKYKQLLREKSSQWGPMHPEIRNYLSIKEDSYKTFSNRSKRITNFRNKQIILDLASISSDSKKSELFSSLILSKARLKGMIKKNDELQKQLKKLRKKINNYSQHSQKLEILTKDFQIAEAIYTSFITANISKKQDYFGSYPLIQIMSQATLPKKPSSPKAVILIPSASIATLFFLIGLWLLWIRKPFILKIFPNA